MATKAEEKKTAAKADEKGTTWLSEVIEQKTGKTYSSYQLRILLRKLAKNGDIERGEGRYVFTGVNDPNVKAIISAVKSGALDEETKKRTGDAKKAAAKKAAPATKRRAPKTKEPVPAVVEEDVEDDLDDELDEL